ncbi:MAG: hypothetical protein D4R77_05855 [Planctomycetaceae bacterium]|nr:MAG: hypothetical protein D4R77_05855 [Planctomycetaceae bacterium]
MKLGVLGIDRSIAAVVAAAHRAGDTISLVCDVEGNSHNDEMFKGVPVDSDWEALLDEHRCDAVLVGARGWSDVRAEGVRKLVQAGRHLIVSHPVELSMLWCYELDMIRQDSKSRIIPCLSDRLHPFLRILQQQMEASLAGVSPLGDIEGLSIERRSESRSKDSVLRHLARDVDLIRALAGDPARLSTFGDADPTKAWSTLAVQFTGPAHVTARWQIQGLEFADQQIKNTTFSATIRVTFQRGICTIDIPSSRHAIGTWRMSSPDSTSPNNQSILQSLDFDSGAAILQILKNSDLHPHTKISLNLDDSLSPATWSDACRAIELAETVPRSLDRNRSIELHREEFSEIGTFKGTMASLGCGLVLIVLGVLFVATLLGAIAREAGWEWAEWIAGIWPQVVLSILGMFLALQILPWFIEDRRKSDRE